MSRLRLCVCVSAGLPAESSVTALSGSYYIWLVQMSVVQLSLAVNALVLMCCLVSKK
jgi:hypothetical protein